MLTHQCFNLENIKGRTRSPLFQGIYLTGSAKDCSETTASSSSSSLLVSLHRNFRDKTRIWNAASFPDSRGVLMSLPDSSHFRSLLVVVTLIWFLLFFWWENTCVDERIDRQTDDDVDQMVRKWWRDNSSRRISSSFFIPIWDKKERKRDRNKWKGSLEEKRGMNASLLKSS